MWSSEKASIRLILIQNYTLPVSGLDVNSNITILKTEHIFN